MKKILALLLALAMVLSLAACSNSGAKDSQKPAEESKEPAAVTADDIDDNMTSSDGKYEVAFITDVGQLKDKSFNKGNYACVKLFAH